MHIGDGTHEHLPADPIELIARIEGSSNFYSLLAGIEAGPDTTGVMGALAFTRNRGAIPELLEAHVAQSVMFRLPLMTVAFRAICLEIKPKPKDYPWIQGAVADAFNLIRRGHCPPQQRRAKHFHVGHETYGTVRKLAHGIFSTILNEAIAEFKKARRSGGKIPSKVHYHHEGEGAVDFKQGPHCYVTPKRGGQHDNDRGLTLSIAGAADRLGWDDRNAVPSPVKQYTPT